VEHRWLIRGSCYSLPRWVSPAIQTTAWCFSYLLISLSGTVRTQFYRSPTSAHWSVMFSTTFINFASHWYNRPRITTSFSPPQSLGERGHLFSRYIVMFHCDFLSNVFTKYPAGYMLNSFKKYPSIQSQCNQGVHADYFLKSNHQGNQWLLFEQEPLSSFNFM